jgi:hypothetical protein
MRPRIALRILKKTSAHETRETNERGANGAGQVAPTAILIFFVCLVGEISPLAQKPNWNYERRWKKLRNPNDEVRSNVE